MTVPSNHYQLAVIGAGPGGYVAAIRAAQLGLSTVVVERDALGGVCLNWGCIPSKAILRNAEVVSLFHRAQEFGVGFDNFTVDYSKAISRSRRVVNRMTRGVAHLLRKNGVEHVAGEARFVDAHTLRVSPDDTLISAENVIIATGARPRTIPILPIDEEIVITSRQALEQTNLPTRAVVLGGGAIGVELASVYNSYGVNVTIVEMMPRLLPNEDAEISKLLERSLRRKGINIMTDARAFAFELVDDGAVLKVETESGEVDVHCGRILVAVGVQGNVENLGLESIGVAPDRGFIPVDDDLATSAPDVYAIGDVNGKLLLAHAASAQGVYVVEKLAGNNPPSLNYVDMPKATYCSPQVASMGLTEEQAKTEGYDVKVGRFPYMASGKAAAMGESEGMVKLVSDAAYGEILGAHMIGADVTELLAEVSMTRMLEGGVTEVGWMVHAHPTLSEALKEASLDAAGASLHT